MIEFLFLTEMPKSSSSDGSSSSTDRVMITNGAVGGYVRRSIADNSRADSYENFDKEEGRRC